MSATSDGAIYDKVCGNVDRLFDVIFVHGLTGSPSATWTSRDGNSFWPQWVCDDLPGVAAHTVGYPASIFAKWAKKEMNIHERAAHALEHMSSSGLGDRPIAFVCHSLGGILVKEILRASDESIDEDWKAISLKTKLVIFYATPHLGAPLAGALRAAAPHVTSSFIDELANHSGYLTNSNQSYRDLAVSQKYSTVSYYEKFKSKGLSLVVSPESADPGISGSRPVPIDANHMDICKPIDRSDLIYTSALRHLKKVEKACKLEKATMPQASAFDLDDYAQECGTDRRDLLQKLIDAGREHEYALANSYQNKFAQKYYKLGLLTDAKTNSDTLLSSVCQRFITHVYTACICKGASDTEIATALQAEVIDPMCQQGIGADAILQALYFLTEQCYIRWDAE